MKRVVSLSTLCILVVIASSSASAGHQDPGYHTKRITIMLHDHCKASVEEIVPSKAAPSRFQPLGLYEPKKGEDGEHVELPDITLDGKKAHTIDAANINLEAIKKIRAEAKSASSSSKLIHKPHPQVFSNWTEEHGFKVHEHGMEGLSREGKEFRYLVTFQAGLTSSLDVEEVGHMFIDPRLRFADGVHGDHPETLEQLHKHDPSQQGTSPKAAKYFLHEPGDGEFVWVPDFVDSIKLYCHNMSASVQFDISSSNPVYREVPFYHPENQNRQTAGRDFQAQQTTGELYYNPKTLQSTGPVASQPNIIFISAGYVKTTALDQEGDFDATIERIMDLLDSKYSSSGGYSDPDTLSSSGATYKVSNTAGLKNQHASVPFDRYWPLFNVFSVFQASPQEGSSYPKRGITVNDNLGCYHPITAERAVTCSVTKSVALASASGADVQNYPDKAIIVVIVNTFTYGGTGIFRAGKLHVGHFFKGIEKSSTGEETVYNNDKYASLINHELGHSFGNLFDEYDIQIAEPSVIKLLNCQAGSGGAPNPPQWSYWISLADVATPTSASYLKYRGRVSTDLWGVTQTPTLPCGYSNYYKPNENCMMGAVADFYMCPVCREQSTKTIMVSTVADGQDMEYQWPRFPLPDPILLILDDTNNVTGTNDFVTVSTGVTLHMPSTLGPSNDYSLNWTHNGAAITPSTAGGPISTTDCAACLVMDSTLIRRYWTPGDYSTVFEFYANVTDDTIFIAPTTRPEIPSLVQSYKFKWQVVTVANLSSMTNVTANDPVINAKAAFGRDNRDSRKTYQQCLSSVDNPNPLCNLSFTTKTYESPADLDALLAEYDQWVLYVVGGVAVLFLLLWAFAANYYSSKSHNVVRPIFRVEFHGCVSVIRKIMMGSAILFMLATLGTMGLSVYVYLNTSALGKILVLAGMMLSTGLYIMAFIGFWAVSYRSKKLVLINGGFLIFGLLILVTIAIAGITLGDQIQQDDSWWSTQLETFWKDQVKDSPEQACAIQGMLQCSGYIVACNSFVTSTVYCPTNCEETNQRYATSCRTILQNWIHDNYTYILAVIFGCIGLMLVAIIFNFYYYYSLVKMKRAIRERMNKKVQRHAQKKGISKQQMNNQKALLILKTLDDGDHTHLIKEFRRIDVDGSGELDKAEMATFFKKALCYKPSAAEIDEIFNVADLDKSGSISLEEFLCIFDANAVHKMDYEEAKPKKVQSVLGRANSALGRGRGRGRGGRGSGRGRGEMGQPLMKEKSMSEDRKAEIQRRAAMAYGDGHHNSEMGNPKMAAPGPGPSTSVLAHSQPHRAPAPTGGQPARGAYAHLPGGAPTGGAHSGPREDLL